MDYQRKLVVHSLRNNGPGSAGRHASAETDLDHTCGSRGHADVLQQFEDAATSVRENVCNNSKQETHQEMR